MVRLWIVVGIGVVMQAALWGQARPARMNPAHLSEMPLVERVMKEITGASPRDTAARQMGAFAQLQEVVEELSQGRTAIGTATADEKKVLDEYRNAYYVVQTANLKNPKDDQEIRELRRFDEDPGVREEVLTKFLSPALQVQSRSISARLMAGRAEMRRNNTAFGGTAIAGANPAQGAAVLPGVAAPAPVKPAAALPPDPSIAKAKAAGVDTKVLGMQMGDALYLQKCQVLAPADNCIPIFDVLGMSAALAEAMGLTANGELVAMAVGSNNCPDWLADCQATVVLGEGKRLVAVSMSLGTKVEQDVREALTAKYGKAFTAREHIIIPNNGGARFTVLDLEWNLPGLHVRYAPVDADVNTGSLLIETEARAAQKVESKKNAPKL